MTFKRSNANKLYDKKRKTLLDRGIMINLPDSNFGWAFTLTPDPSPLAFLGRGAGGEGKPEQQ
jgi:hypothetical protein